MGYRDDLQAATERIRTLERGLQEERERRRDCEHKLAALSNGDRDPADLWGELARTRRELKKAERLLARAARTEENSCIFCDGSLQRGYVRLSGSRAKPTIAFLDSPDSSMFAFLNDPGLVLTDTRPVEATYCRRCTRVVFGRLKGL